jgi:hypothetical protein
MDWPNRGTIEEYAHVLRQNGNEIGHAIASGSSSSALLKFFEAMRQTGAEIPVVNGYASYYDLHDPLEYPWMVRMRI